jgi:hypothetical protein
MSSITQTLTGPSTNRFSLSWINNMNSDLIFFIGGALTGYAMFFLALIPLYSYICYSSAVLTAPLIAFAAFVTIYHDVQYHAIIWFYSRNRYHKLGIDKKKYGLAPILSNNVIIYLIAAIGMGLIMRLFGCSLELHPGCGPLILTSQSFMFGEITTKELLFSILVGVPLHHYFVDQFIWRPSRDKDLQRDLKIAK